MSIIKTITLKYEDGRRETELILADDEAKAQKQINALMRTKGAYGFSTQSNVVQSQHR